ncbi:MAG: acetate--CoA ligase family protein, partial [Gemmatimonadota bacterium]|nr:acetate--CoA ligase family protein [Gemmatimonadota bacterium]
VGLFGGYGIRFADTLTAGEIRAAAAMAESARAAGRGLVVHSMYALHRSQPLVTLGAARVPVVPSLEVACRCVASLHARGRWLERPAWRYVPPIGGAGKRVDPTPDRMPPHPAIVQAREEGRATLTEPEARDLLASFQLSFTEGVVVDSAEGVVEAVGRFGRPVAVKLVSAVLSHKSDVGGVELDVDDAAGARAAYEAIDRRARAELTRRGREGTGPASVLVTPMEEAPRVELLVGAVRDRELGPVLTVGAGGIWVDTLEDVSTRVLPVDDLEVAEMLRELRIWRTAGAARGRAAVGLEPVVDAVMAVADAITRRPEIAEVEVNPLFVYEDRVAPIDARVALVD